MVYLFLAGLRGWEIIIIAIVVLLLFGGKRIPELMRSVGKGIRGFKEGLNSPDDSDADVTQPDKDDKEDEK